MNNEDLSIKILESKVREFLDLCISTRFNLIDSPSPPALPQAPPADRGKFASQMGEFYDISEEPI